MLLDGHQVQIYVYLREQAEIIQTGYAQQMKTRRQVTKLEDFNASKALLTPVARDYGALLEKLSAVFGKNAIDIGIFERERLRDGNIVNDMLEKLSLKPDHEFAQFGHEQNISLDLPSLVILNEMDRRNETDAGARHAAVDILMNDISLLGAGEKYFLSAEDVTLVRESFAASNTRVVENYLDRNWPHAALFSYHGNPWNTSAPADIAQAVSRKNSVLARHTDYPTWNGKTVSGVDLQRFVVATDEWLPATAAGLSTQSAACTLRFRVEWRHITPAHSRIALNIVGRTGAQVKDIQILVNGVALGELLPNASRIGLQIPLEQIPDYGLVNIQLRAHYARPPHLPGDGDFAGFILESLQFLLLK